jgi:hypothetical protein
MRRRARFLRKARELAFRDLGGLVFDMHRFGERNDQVLTAKLGTLRQIDAELRALERALRENRGVTVLREVGIAACPRCAAIHGRDDRFCPGCGMAFDTHAERPLATAPISIPHPPSSSAAPAPSGPAKTAQPPPVGEPAGTAQPPPPEGKPAGTAQPPQPVGEPAGTAQPPPPEGEESAKTWQPPVPAAPPIKPTFPPVAARPTPERPQPAGDEDEPTQILRPPVRGG